MCYPKPGPRCSSHARKRMQAAYQAHHEIRAEHDQMVREGASQEELEAHAQKVLAAGRKHRQAKSDYEETPEGLKRFQEIEDQLRADGQVRAALLAKKDRLKALERREEKLAKWKASERFNPGSHNSEEQFESHEQAAKPEVNEEAQRHLDAAAAAERRAAESWERSDTDGFASQWASGMTGQLERAKAEIAQNGGKAEFSALFDTNGNMVPAKRVKTQYGMAWGLLSNPDDPSSSFTGWVSESKASTPEKRAAALERKGYRVGTVRVPAGAKIDAPEGARGLGGATSTFINVYRKDGGFSKDAEVVSNGSR